VERTGGVGDPMAVELAGLRFQSPIVLAAGTAGYADEILDVLDPRCLGAVTSKSITLQPRDGHPTWRMVPVRGGMLNAIGLANMGVDRFASHVVPAHRLGARGVALLASVAGNTIDAYAAVAAALDELEPLAGVELNVSCPNVHGGADFGADPRALADLVSAVRAALPTKPLLVKLPPAVGGGAIVELARAAIDARGRVGGPRHRPGADALTIANTIPALAIDVASGRPRLSNASGGLSGPPIHHVAVKLVHDAHAGVARGAGVPIIGLGGVTRWQDAAELILAGATAVGIGTAMFADPTIPARVFRGLRRWVRGRGCASVGELVGAVRGGGGG